MIVSLYASAEDKYPRRHECASFVDLAAVLGDEHDVLEPNEKGKTPISQEAFAACEFDGKGRKTANVVRVHFGAIDIDKKPLEHVSGVLDLFRDLPSFVYSTFSHGKAGVPGVSLRWLFPFTRPIEVHGDPSREWEPYIAGFQALTDRIIDTEKDPTRLFFVPTRRPEATDAFLLYSPGAGRALDVDAVIALGRRILAKPTDGPRAALEPDIASSTFTINDLTDVASTLTRSKSSALKAIGVTLGHVVKGQVYTREPDRDSHLFKMCGQIAEFFPHADPVAVASLFATSIAATNDFHHSGNANEDLNKVVEKLTRLQEKVRFRLEVKKEEHEKEQRADISAAFAAIGIDRDYPYTEEEIEQIKKDVGATSFEELKRMWILQHGTAYYVNVLGQYLAPVPEKSLMVTARRDLAPALTADVRLTVIDDDGKPRELTRDALLARHATAARSTLIDLNAQHTSYNRATQTITEAPCPMRTDIVPKFEPAIDEWIAALAGNDENADKFRQWTAFVTFLDRPCVAIYLDGPPGAGKTLYAKAISRIWGKSGPTELKDLIKDWNDAIVRNGIVFADEAIPRDMLEGGTRLLREFQQNTTRKLKRKFMPIADMIGAIRLIMASNNKNMIETNEALTNVDIEAITERFLYLKASDRARDILRSWGDAACAKVVTEDILAAHALYLRENAGAWIPRGRFMIPTAIGHNALSRSLTTHSGDRSIVCHWLVSYLQNPHKYDVRNQHLIHIRDGELWVNAEALTVDWEVYVTNAKAPRTNRLSQALDGLSINERKQARIRGDRIRFYIIDNENLIAWAEENGISSREQITHALTVNTKISSKVGLSAIPQGSPFQKEESK